MGTRISAALRQTARVQADAVAGVGQPSVQGHEQLADLLLRRVTAAHEAGLAPEQPQSAAIVDDLAVGSPDSADFRRWLAELLHASSDERYERYWYLLAVVNDWPRPPTGLAAAAGWLTAGLRASAC